MSSASISAVLAGRVPLDEVATVNGWVKTRRDSKAGFSFLAISDGSCFDSIQIVAPNSLPNYTSEVLQITTGCAVTCTGKLVRSQGKGQAIEMQADQRAGAGLGREPGCLSRLGEAPHVRIPARSRAPAAAHEYFRRGDPRAPRARDGDAQVLSRERVLLDPYADRDCERRRRRRRDVQGLDARSREPSEDPRGADRLRAGLLRPADVPDRLGSAECRGVLPRHVEGLHVRPHFSRRAILYRRATSPSSG